VFCSCRKFEFEINNDSLGDFLTLLIWYQREKQMSLSNMFAHGISVGMLLFQEMAAEDYLSRFDKIKTTHSRWQMDNETIALSILFEATIARAQSMFPCI
jgi:hypothetical protein